MSSRHAWMFGAGAALLALAAGVVLDVEAFLGLVLVAFLACAGMIALSLQLAHPSRGVFLLVVMAVAFPFEFRGPAGVMMSSSLPLSALLCGIWLLRISYESTAFDASRMVLALAVFLGSVLVAFAVGQFPLFPSGGAPLPAQVVELGLFLLSGLLLLVVGHQLDSVTQLQRLVWLFLAAGAVACVFQTFPQFAFVARWTSRPGSVGSLFWTWLVAIALSQATFNRTLSWPLRLALVGLTALVFFHGLVQVRSWASGWLPPLVALGVIVLARVPRLSLGAGLVALPVGLIVGSYLAGPVLQEEAYSLMTRQEAWSVLWPLVEQRPLFGTGMANYYYYTENLPLLGWYVRFISHNNYQDLMVQTGFLGLLAFCWFAGEAFLMIMRLYGRVPAGFPEAYVVGAFAGLSGSLVSGMLGDWMIPFYYNAGVLGFRSSLLLWVFLGGVLALKRVYFGSGRSEAPARQPVVLARRAYGLREAR